MWSRTSSARPITLLQSNRGSTASSPYLAAVRIAWATLPALTSALVGTQPWLVQVPPKWLASTSRIEVLPPSATAKAASDPAAPAPMMTRS